MKVFSRPSLDAIVSGSSVFYIESALTAGLLLPYDVSELTLKQLFNGRVTTADYRKGDIPLCPVENIAGREETYWLVTDSTLVIHAASEVEISHLTAQNSDVTITSLTTGGTMTTTGSSANGGGGYTGKTLRFIGGTDHDSLSMTLWGDIVLLNDENDKDTVHGADVFTLTDAQAVLTSVNGGVNSASVHDIWTITNSALNVTAKLGADIGEGGTITNSSVVTPSRMF